MVLALLVGCGAQEPPRRSSGRGSTGGVANPPVIDPYRDPCWCYTEPEEDAIRIVFEAARDGGMPYDELLLGAPEVCLGSLCGTSGCLTCYAHILEKVYDR